MPLRREQARIPPHEATGAVQVVDARAHPGVAERSHHIARMIRREGLAAIGLCPGSDDVAVLPAAAQVGVALAEQSGSPVALLDINARWSALPPPPDRSTLAGPLLLTRWLAASRLALVSLSPHTSIGAGLIEMARLVQSGRSMFEHVLVDLTGLDRLGEHLAAASMCDALIFVAQAGKTTERDLERLGHDFAAHRSMGVVLIGTKA